MESPTLAKKKLEFDNVSGLEVPQKPDSHFEAGNKKKAGHGKSVSGNKE